MTAVCMIHGATGFTGRLILDAALARGLRPVVAGRSEGPVTALAERHQLPFRIFSLTEPEALTEALEDVDVVLNAALIPATAERLAQACIRHGVHYLDIGCDLPVLQRLAALDEAARQAGVALVPGAGFSPAVAETLAVHLKRRLPDTVRLTVALCAAARPSPGLIRSGLEIALRPSAALRRGQVKTTRRRRMCRFDFGRGPEPCYGLGWGELAAIHRATGVRNVDFFVRARPDLVRLLRLSPLLAACRGLPPLREKFDAFAAAHERQPAARQSRSRVAGFAYDPSGQRAATRLHLPDPYTVTAALAAAALARAAESPPPPGLHTAGQFLGPDFLAALPGIHVDWEELELSAPGEVKLRIRRRVPLTRRLYRLWSKSITTGNTAAPEKAGPAGTAETVAPARRPMLQAVSSVEARPEAGTQESPPAETGDSGEAVEHTRRTG